MEMSESFSNYAEFRVTEFMNNSADFRESRGKKFQTSSTLERRMGDCGVLDVSVSQ
jgi:hypothetical protein